MSMIEGKCATCGKTIEFFASQKRKYCSQACAKKALSGKPIPWLDRFRSRPRSLASRKKTSLTLKARKRSRAHQARIDAGIRKSYREGRKPWNYGKENPYMQGPRHRWWKGGRFKTKAGYIKVFSPGHPWARNKGASTPGAGGYVFEHRLVMERFLGRHLLPEEKVHHRNGVKDDNRLANLQLIAGKPHYGEVTCPHCHKDFLIH